MKSNSLNFYSLSKIIVLLFFILRFFVSDYLTIFYSSLFIVVTTHENEEKKNHKTGKRIEEIIQETSKIVAVYDLLSSCLRLSWKLRSFETANYWRKNQIDLEKFSDGFWLNYWKWLRRHLALMIIDQLQLGNLIQRWFEFVKLVKLIQFWCKRHLASKEVSVNVSLCLNHLLH